MHADHVVSSHYSHGNLLNLIEAALAKLGKTINDITVDELAPVDEFHIGGRVATESLLNKLNFSEADRILDVGCGLGGAARYVACHYHNCVTGIDLVDEYVETGKVMTEWLKLGKQVSLHHGSALAMPFDDASFDGGYMLHVGMNISDKVKLFSEINRVLRSGARFGVYDVMRMGDGQLSYPVPWAAEEGDSAVATPQQYKDALTQAGFEICSETNRREFALDFFQKLRAKMASSDGPPPLGLHLLMKESAADKIKNMIDNIAANYIAPVEIIIRKQ